MTNASISTLASRTPSHITQLLYHSTLYRYLLPCTCWDWVCQSINLLFGCWCFTCRWLWKTRPTIFHSNNAGLWPVCPQCNQYFSIPHPYPAPPTSNNPTHHSVSVYHDCLHLVVHSLFIVFNNNKEWELCGGCERQVSPIIAAMGVSTEGWGV